MRRAARGALVPNQHTVKHARKKLDVLWLGCRSAASHPVCKCKQHRERLLPETTDCPVVIAACLTGGGSPVSHRLDNSNLAKLHDHLSSRCRRRQAGSLLLREGASLSRSPSRHRFQVTMQPCPATWQTRPTSASDHRKQTTPTSDQVQPDQINCDQITIQPHRSALPDLLEQWQEVGRRGVSSGGVESKEGLRATSFLHL